MTKGPDHWRMVHLRGDAAAPFVRDEPRRPFWRPLWEEKREARR